MPSKRIVYYDLLNILACFCVVYLHCNDMVHTYRPGLNWACGLAIEVLCYWAVPVFFMLSGATLMRYRDRYDTKTFFKKRLVRVLVPFIAWSIIIYILRFGIEEPSTQFGTFEFLNLFFSNGIEGVYWFFFPLLSLYLSMPVLSLLADKKKLLLYIAATSFVLQSVAPIACGLAGITWNSQLSLSVAGGYVMYAVLGYLISTSDLSKRVRLGIYCLAISSLALRYGFTYVSSSQLGVVDRTFFTYMGFTAVFLAMGIFTWFKYHDWSRKPNLEKLSKQICAISSCSFGVYLIHRIVLADFVFRILEVSPLSVPLRTIGPILIYLACLTIVYLVKKIPGLKMLVP